MLKKGIVAFLALAVFTFGIYAYIINIQKPYHPESEKPPDPIEQMPDDKEKERSGTLLREKTYLV